METIGIGIVGCGYWGTNLTRVFSELQQSRLLHVCDLSTERLERVHQRFPWVEADTSLAELLANPKVRAVVVATPLSAHYDIVRQCLLAGKHVLVEKPFVRTVAQGEELIDLAVAHHQVLMVGHTFLYNPAVQKMKACVQSQDIGQIYYLHATRTNMGPIRDDASALWDLVPHDISIFGYLLDVRPLWVSAVGTASLGNCRQDVGFVTLAYPKGILGHIHVSWLDPDKVREVVVVGSNKRIVFNDLNTQEKLRIYEKGVAHVHGDVASFGEFQLRIRDGDIVSPKVEASEPLKNECCHFLDCINAGDRPLSDGENGLEIVKILIAVDKSMSLDGAPVEVAA